MSESSGQQLPGSRRAARSGPTSIRRVIVPALLAIAAIVALLVAFNSCSDPYDQGAGLKTPIGEPTLSPTSPQPSASATNSPSSTASTTQSPSPTTPTPSPSASASTTPSAAPTSAPKREVEVLNGTSTPGLAATYATKVRRAGWTVARVGNWSGAKVTATTIFYPAGFKASAQRLADELSGTQNLRASLGSMSSSVLTIVVAN